MNYTTLKESEFAQNFKGSDVLCDHFKDKSRYIELPNDAVLFVKDNWFMLNIESEYLGNAIKNCVNYLTKNAKKGDNNG